MRRPLCFVACAVGCACSAPTEQPAPPPQPTVSPMATAPAAPTVAASTEPTAAATATATATAPPKATKQWRQVSAGVSHTCGIDQGGTVWCWGAGEAGQLGSGAANTHKPVKVAVSDATQIGAGRDHTCALLADGTVSCWGTLPTTTAAVGPTKIAGLPKIKQIAVGHTMTCALHDFKGRVSCWGLNKKHQLGDGSSINRDKPVPVPMMYYADAIASGERHSCILKRGGPECFGANKWGQSSPLLKGRPTRRSVAGVSKATLITTGVEHSCAVSGPKIHCWGHNDKGQLGTADKAAKGPALAKKLAKPITAITAGSHHTCVLAGDVMCWGSNDKRQLGADAAWTVVAVEAARSITAGGHHTCAIDKAERLTCWGDNSSGQLGRPKSDKGLAPAPI